MGSRLKIKQANVTMLCATLDQAVCLGSKLGVLVGCGNGDGLGLSGARELSQIVGMNKWSFNLHWYDAATAGAAWAAFLTHNAFTTMSFADAAAVRC